jgi:hypothetical protein
MYKNKTEMKKGEKREIKKALATFSYKSSRVFLTEVFLRRVKKMKYTSAEISRLSRLSRGTLSTMMRGGYPNLATLRHLFTVSFPFQLLTPDEAGIAVISIISDSLVDSSRHPVFRIEPLTEASFPEPLPSLPAYMKRLREHHLHISVREACLQFEHCDTLQMSRIERDCHRVGIGPVCYLFNSYLDAIPALADDEWGMFATLLLHHLFPIMSGYRLCFIGYID